MKTIITLSFSILFLNAFSQEIAGAWEYRSSSQDGNDVLAVAIVTEGYFACTWYEAKDGSFVGTRGGKCETADGIMTETVEFNTKDSSEVGTIRTRKIKISESNLTYLDSDETWTRIDDGTPGALAGAWLITGRQRGDEIVERDPYRPRKTMKILSGTRFQWIAYNTETKQFMGTGGGTYTTLGGKYTENIAFFSRDDSRVGASLEFEFALVDGKWHHSGKSSKGDPIYEVWSLRDR